MIELHTVFSQKQRQALSKDLPTPLYFQLYKLLKNGILDGTFINGPNFLPRVSFQRNSEYPELPVNARWTNWPAKVW